MFAPEAPLKSYAWSSFPGSLKSAPRRPAWLRVDRLLGEHGIPEDSPAGRQMFEERLEAVRRAEGQSEAWAPVRRGWCSGEEPFRQEWLARMSEWLGMCPRGHLNQPLYRERKTGGE